MSKFTKRLMATKLNEGYPEYCTTYSIKETISPSDSTMTPMIAYKYSIRATFGSTVYIKEGEDHTRIINEIKRFLIEDLFGEFRYSLNQLRCLIHNRDWANAHVVLDEIEKNMFEV